MRKLSLRPLIVLSTSLLTVFSCTSTQVNSDALEQANIQEKLPKNVIMVVADGMGPAYITAYRNFMDDPDTDEIEPIIVDDILLGTARTYPDKVSGYVTDSAASATALAAGVKTYNGAIGMSVDKQAVESVLHRARKYGMKTGLAVTSTIVHATPASYMVANESRHNYNEIADSFFEQRINGQFLADIMLGAGHDHFIREDRNIVEEFKQNGYQYIDQYSQLNSLEKNKPVIGLFGKTALPWAMDDTDPTRLSALTDTALKHLENPNGFFLLVEASQVDWAGHGNDIASAMAEMHDFAKAIERIKLYVESHPDTLVIITADHSTGGLTIAANGEYRWDPKYIKDIKASVSTIGKALRTNDDKVAYLESVLGFEISNEQQNLLSLINEEMPEKDIQNLVKRIIDEKTNTGWTTSGHTGIDVNVYGFGPGSERFTGNINNTDIAKNIFKLLDEANAGK